MKNMKSLIALMFLAILFTGCSPQKNDGLTPTSASYSPGVPDPLYLYNGNLIVGAAPNVYEYSPTSQTNATVNVNLNDTSVKPIAGNANIQDELTNYNQTTWVGFPILCNSAIDLTSANFSKITFYAQALSASASTPSTIVFTGFNNGGPVTTALTNSWQQFSLSITAPVTGAANTELFVANCYSTLVTAPVTVYVDEIVYQ